MKEEVLGYICSWTVLDECTVNKIACRRRYRRLGIGGILLRHLKKEAYLKGARTFILEVRISNMAARIFTAISVLFRQVFAKVIIPIPMKTQS